MADSRVIDPAVLDYPGVLEQADPRACEIVKELARDPKKDRRNALQSELIEILKEDWPTFAALCLKVRNKIMGGITPFVFNQPQSYLWNFVIVPMLQAGMPLFLVILKARQFGISTFWVGWDFWQAWRQNDVHALIVAHEKPTAEHLVATLRVFYDNLPLFVKPRLRAKSMGATVPRGEMFFIDQRAGINTVVEGASDPRGPQYTHIHETEHSSYGDPHALNGALLPQLPARGSPQRAHCTFVIESTPKGQNEFRDAYMACSNKENKSDSVAVFLEWFCNNVEYSVAAPSDYRLTNEEKRKQEEYSLVSQEKYGRPVSRDQMYWRKLTIEGPECNGDEDMFDQEYPSDDISCFLLQTKNVFKKSARFLDACVSNARIRAAKYWTEELGVEHKREVTVRFDWTPPPIMTARPTMPNMVIDPHGKWKIWRKPIKGHHYAQGSDVAGGFDTGREKDLDYSTSCIIDVDEAEQVAEYKGLIIPEHFAKELVMAGFYYNTALTNIELNGLGIVTARHFMGTYMYPNPYKWVPLDEITKASHKRMWWTDDKMKAFLVSTMMHMVGDQLIKISSLELFREMSVFEGRASEDTGNYKFEAASGKDDLVMAFGLCLQAIFQTPKLRALLPLGDNEMPTPRELGIDAGPQQQTFTDVEKALGIGPKPQPWDPMVSI